MTPLMLYDTYEPYYAGRESLMSTGHREETPDRRDEQRGEQGKTPRDDRRSAH